MPKGPRGETRPAEVIGAAIARQIADLDLGIGGLDQAFDLAASMAMQWVSWEANPAPA